MQLPFVRGQSQDDRGKAPVWKHGAEMRVRKAGDADFTKNSPRFGIEVYEDENNGNLIYLTDTGSIAVVHPTK
jgi:hypothetical protein